MHLARERLKFIFSQSAYCFESPDCSPSFPEMLLDLSQYECDELVQGSLHLLNRFFSSELSLFNKAIQTQLLVTEQSKKIFTEVEELLLTLRRYMNIDAEERERSVIIRVLKSLTRMCFLEEVGELPHRQNQRILYNSGKVLNVRYLCLGVETLPHTYYFELQVLCLIY